LLKWSKIYNLCLKKAKKVLTKLCCYSNNISIVKLKGGHDGNSLLHEVQEKGRDEKPRASYTQEPQASNQGCLSYLWHKSIQDRESLNIYRGARRVERGHVLAVMLFVFA
jgi:hypothetical protein